MLYKLRYKIVDIMREASQAGHTAGIRGVSLFLFIKLKIGRAHV